MGNVISKERRKNYEASDQSLNNSSLWVSSLCLHKVGTDCNSFKDVKVVLRPSPV